jgi:hypothetical protein
MTTEPSTDYDDEDDSCSQTFCTLRLFSAIIAPDQISAALQVEPTSSHCAGELVSPRGTARRTEHDWQLSTESFVSSRDLRRHVDWLLARLFAAESAFHELRANGLAVDIFVYWRSARGQGGPLLSVPQLKGLAKLELECVFDIYFDEPAGA